MASTHSNWMDLGLSKEVEERLRKGAELYRVTYLDNIDTVFEIAACIEILRTANYGTGVQGSFADALVQYGFTNRDGGPIDKSIRSNYKALLDHEEDVRAWWNSKRAHEKRDWDSARAIYRNWQASKKPPPTEAEKAAAKTKKIEAAQRLLGLKPGAPAAMAQDWVAAGIGAKPSAEAMEAKQAANAKAELEEELARAKSQAPGVVTWHDLIQQAIVLLRGMPEDSRHEAMNQWSSAVAVNVQFPGKSKHKQKAADGKTKAAAPAEATALKWAGQYPEAALAEDGGKYAVFKTESVTTAGKTVLLGYDVYFSPTGSTEEKDKLKLGRAKTSKAAKAIAEAHAAKKTKAEAKPPTAWSWTDTAIGFERLPGKKATVDGKTHTVYIGPRGKPVWTMSTGKRGQPSHKVLPPEVDTIEAAMAAVERLYAE